MRTLAKTCDERDMIADNVMRLLVENSTKNTKTTNAVQDKHERQRIANHEARLDVLKSTAQLYAEAGRFVLQRLLGRNLAACRPALRTGACCSHIQINNCAASHNMSPKVSAINAKF